MKLLKSLSLGLLATTAIAGSASAQTVVHIVGSTAYRAPDTAAVIDYLSSNLAPGSTKVYAGYVNSGTSGLLGSSAGILANGTVGTTGSGSATIIVETYWTGSLAGVVDLVAANKTGAYVDPSGISSAATTGINGATVTTSPYGGGFQITDSITTKTSAPDIAFSDSYQGTISKELGTGAVFASGTTSVGSETSVAKLSKDIAGSFITDAGTESQTGGTNAGDALVVGVVPFAWCVGNVSAGTSGYTEIGQNTAKQLIGTGYVPESFISGAAPTGNDFYLVGRNEDSGTRIGALSEPGFGVTATPVQFQVTGYSGNGAGASAPTEKYPITALNTEPGIVWNTAGHSGYAAGSDVQKALNLAESSTAPTFGSTGGSSGSNGAAYFIGYLGLTDAAGLSGNAHILMYDGVTPSQAAVENGQYTFWTYEHCYRLSSITGTTIGNIADAIADKVFATDADISNSGSHTQGTAAVSAGCLYLDMNCNRNVVEGGPVLNNFNQ